MSNILKKKNDFIEKQAKRNSTYIQKTKQASDDYNGSNLQKLK